jgi:hypothetical protein
MGLGDRLLDTCSAMSGIKKPVQIGKTTQTGGDQARPGDGCDDWWNRRDAESFDSGKSHLVVRRSVPERQLALTGVEAGWNLLAE